VIVTAPPPTIGPAPPYFIPSTGPGSAACGAATDNFLLQCGLTWLGGAVGAVDESGEGLDTCGDAIDLMSDMCEAEQ
jgi:hypothetical protein